MDKKYLQSKLNSLGFTKSDYYINTIKQGVMYEIFVYQYKYKYKLLEKTFQSCMQNLSFEAYDLDSNSKKIIIAKVY